MKSQFSFLAALLLLAAALFGAMPAGAQSLYDDAYQTVDSLVLEYDPVIGDACPPLDISSTYMSLMEDESLWAWYEDKDYFNIDGLVQAQSSGAWFLSTATIDGPNAYRTNVYIGYTLQSGQSLGWSSDEVTAPVDIWTDIVYSRTSNGICKPTVGVSAGANSMTISSTSGTQVRNVIAQGYDNSYPYGYEGQLVQDVWTPPGAQYVAMGDSFSSGEGNPLFEFRTDENGVNECHRSHQAYPRLLQADSNLELGRTAFVACSGATTSNVLYGGSGTGSWGGVPQVDALSEDTDVVTITIGGNDVGFSTFAMNCILASCRPNSPAYNDIMGNINGTLQDDLEDVYREILQESGDAEVYVVAYPLLVGDSINGSDCDTFGSLNDYGARAVTNALNYRIESAVSEVRMDVSNPDYGNRLTFVLANTSSGASPFDGNFVCSSPSYFNDIEVVNPEYSLHPNTLGHEAYAQIIEGFM